jgi:hypothetical protein
MKETDELLAAPPAGGPAVPAWERGAVVRLSAVGLTERWWPSCRVDDPTNLRGRVVKIARTGSVYVLWDGWATPQVYDPQHMQGLEVVPSTREALAWAYQAIRALWPNCEAMDNLSAVLRGEAPPHQWPSVPPSAWHSGLRQAESEQQGPAQSPDGEGASKTTEE